MFKDKKEKTLIERVLAHEKVDFARHSMHEIEQLVADLVELQANKVRAEDVSKLVGVIDAATVKIREIISKEK